MKHTILPLLGLLFITACGSKTEPPKAQPDAASASPATPEGLLNALTVRQAEDVVRSLGYSEGGAISTGPGEAFSLSVGHPAGVQIEVALNIATMPEALPFYLQDLPEGTPRAQDGLRVLSVQATKGEVALHDDAKVVLDALLERAKNPVEPFAVVTLPANHWFTPRAEAIDGFLVIAPDLTSNTILALQANGVHQAGSTQGQKVDLSNPKDAGYPGVIIWGDKEGHGVEVRITCMRPDTDPQFWPKTHAAATGQAIGIHERCYITVTESVHAGQPDKAHSKALFESLLSWTPPSP